MAWRGARRTLLWLWPIISVGDLSNAWFKIKPAFLFLGKKKKKKKIGCLSSIIFALCPVVFHSFDCYISSQLLLG